MVRRHFRYMRRCRQKLPLPLLFLYCGVVSPLSTPIASLNFFVLAFISILVPLICLTPSQLILWERITFYRYISTCYSTKDPGRRSRIRTSLSPSGQIRIGVYLCMFGNVICSGIVYSIRQFLVLKSSVRVIMDNSPSGSHPTETLSDRWYTRMYPIRR